MPRRTANTASTINEENEVTTVEATEVDTAKADEAKEKQKLKVQARNSALKRLTEAHAEEFRTLLSEEAEKFGVTIKTRVSKEQREREHLEELVAKYGLPA